MSIIDDIRAGKYECKLPYPSLHSPDSKELRRAKRDAYNAEEAALMAQFKCDLISEHGLLEHPKADRAYQIAWDNGHSTGLIDVVYEFEKLVELLK